jgi:hypothetical protein
MSNVTMKDKQTQDVPLDFSKGVRGKYYDRATAGSNVILLDPDLLETFPNSKAVNAALRSLREVALRVAPRKATSARKKSA